MPTGAAANYAIPPGNPFASTANICDKIWQFTTHSGVVGFGEDEAGNLYSVSINGDIRKFVSAFTGPGDDIFEDSFE